ncbi:MAG: hypothetical protein HN867_00500 [Deltaproteobacteria bacterium]|nr:hypothetical protein [Deltaproteobacteria bacterium]
MRILSKIIIILFLNSGIVLSSDEITVSNSQINFLKYYREAHYNLKLIDLESQLNEKLELVQQPERSAMKALVSYSKFAVNFERNIDEKYYKEFIENVNAAIESLEALSSQKPNNISSKLNLGLMYGLKGGVALGYRKDYFDAYRFGVKGVKLLDEVYKNNPQFVDIELSKGILKLMIAQSTWYVRWLAPLIVESGSISEGIGHLDKVVQDGEYVSDEALLAYVLLLWGDVDKDYLSKSLSALEKFTEHYPDNIQIYIVLARGFWLAHEYEKSNFYALQGITKTQRSNSIFTLKHASIIQSFLLYWHYRYLTEKKEWLKLLRQTEQKSELPIQSTFKAVALWNMGQYKSSKEWAEKTLINLKKTELKMPLFIVPFLFDLKPTLQSILETRILGQD